MHTLIWIVLYYLDYSNLKILQILMNIIENAQRDFKADLWELSLNSKKKILKLRHVILRKFSVIQINILENKIVKNRNKYRKQVAESEISVCYIWWNVRLLIAEFQESLSLGSRTFTHFQRKKGIRNNFNFTLLAIKITTRKECK